MGMISSARACTLNQVGEEKKGNLFPQGINDFLQIAVAG